MTKFIKAISEGPELTISNQLKIKYFVFIKRIVRQYKLSKIKKILDNQTNA